MKAKSVIQNLYKQRERHINYANSIVANRQDAEDLVQDCYEKFISKMNELSEQVQNSNAYFIRSLRNKCLDFIRKNKHYTVEVIEDRQVYSITPERILESKQEMGRLEQLMLELPEKQRSVFYLRDIEGFELGEIENVVGISNEAVRTNLSRARKRLRTLYKKVNQ